MANFKAKKVAFKQGHWTKEKKGAPRKSLETVCVVSGLFDYRAWLSLPSSSPQNLATHCPPSNQNTNKYKYCIERKPDLKEGAPPSGEKDGAGKEGKAGPKSGALDPNLRRPYILITLTVQAYSAQKQS